MTLDVALEDFHRSCCKSQIFCSIYLSIKCTILFARNSALQYMARSIDIPFHFLLRGRHCCQGKLRTGCWIFIDFYSTYVYFKYLQCTVCVFNFLLMQISITERGWVSVCLRQAFLIIAGTFWGVEGIGYILEKVLAWAKSSLSPLLKYVYV